MILVKIVVIITSIKLTECYSWKPTLNDSSPLFQCLQTISWNFLTEKENIWMCGSRRNATSNIFEDNFVRSLMLRGHSILIQNKDSSWFKKAVNSWRRICSYIIETSNATELENTLQAMKYHHSWNSKAKFVITVNHIPEEISEMLTSLIEALWSVAVYNFILVITDKNQTENVNIYTWYPYKCQQSYDFSTNHLLDVCKNGKFQNQTDLFPEKIPKIFKSCELKVGAVEWPPYVMKPVKRLDNTDEYVLTDGLEVRLVENIIRKLSMNVTYIMSEKPLNWGYLEENGTGTGLMALLRKGAIDMAIASFSPSVPRVKFFEISTSYYFESFSWCVPHAPIQLAWQKLLTAISYQFWIAFFLSFITFSVLIWLLSRRSQETIYKRYINCLQASVSIALNASVRHLPKTQILRLVTCFWILFSLNFGVLYETQLISVLTRPTYGSQISSLEQILDNNYPIYFAPNILSYVDKNSSFTVHVSKNERECIDVQQCFARVAYDKDSALCLSSSYTHYIKKSYTTKDNIPLIYCFPSNIAKYPVILLMKKDFPLTLRFNDIISSLVEGGFVQFWAENIYTEKWKSEERTKLNSTTDDNLLDLDKLKSAFIVLLTGLAVAMVAFLVESLYFLCAFLKGKRIFIV